MPCNELGVLWDRVQRAILVRSLSVAVRSYEVRHNCSNFEVWSYQVDPGEVSLGDPTRALVKPKIHSNMAFLIFYRFLIRRREENKGCCSAIICMPKWTRSMFRKAGKVRRR